jgi:hypothetical protein
LNSELQNAGTWSGAAIPLRLLCYRPAVFFLRLRLFALWFREDKKGSAHFILIFAFQDLLKS